MVREFRAADITACTEIVNKVWDFKNRFKPKELASLFQSYYTAGSLAQSNFHVVLEERGKTEGFLFGRCGNRSLYKNEYSGLVGSLRFLYRFIVLRGVSFRRKTYYMKILSVHEKNRRSIEPNKLNEVNLFAVDPATQGQGYGKRLMNKFIEHCRSRGAERITLETDEECNYGFYEHFGFSVIGIFDSPLQKEYSGKSGRCFVYELRLRTDL
jgi:ribosomal protein S18 acetylase RimI-like enzyme